jgi:hypothetical protein
VTFQPPVTRFHIFGLTKLDLRQFSGMLLSEASIFYRRLANFIFVPVFNEDNFHKPSDIACHASLLTEFLGGDLSELLPMDVESLFSSVHVA